MTMSRDQIDGVLRRSTRRENPTAAESVTIWAAIEAGLERQAPEPASDGQAQERRSGLRRVGFVVAVAAVAVLAVAGVALSPWIDADRRSGGFDLTRLDSATASEVLRLSAEAAQNQPSLAPGPGQVLYFRLSHTTDPSAFSEKPSPGLERVAIEEWIGADGRGVRLDGLSGSSSMSNGKFSTSPLRMDFDAGRSIDRRLMVSESWRSMLTLDELQSIPADPDPALVYIRDAVGVSVFGSTERQTRYEAGILGVDFLVLSAVSSMLMEAPLSAEQRAALLDVLAEAPQWYRSGGTANVEVANEGVARTMDGREGILIEATLRLNEVEAAIVGSGRRKVGYGVLLDPESGAVLETRISLGPDQRPGLWVTSEVLELRQGKNALESIAD